MAITVEFYQSNFFKNILDKPLHSELPFALINPNKTTSERSGEKKQRERRTSREAQWHKVTFHGKTGKMGQIEGNHGKTIGKC